MPKLYEYFGIVIFFYTNEHEPIHVHARKGGFESKIEFIIIGGAVQEVVIKEVKGRKPLKGQDLKNLTIFIEHFAEEIVQKWVDFFVLHKKIEAERITKRL